MVVKSKLGRKRYIVIKINSEQNILKRDLIHTLNNLNSTRNLSETDAELKNKDDNGKEKYVNSINNVKTHLIHIPRIPWVISLFNNTGLIRCHHLDKQKTIDLLQSIKWIGTVENKVKIETLGTTGTIRSARKKYLAKLILYPKNNLK